VYSSARFLVYQILLRCYGNLALIYIDYYVSGDKNYTGTAEMMAISFVRVEQPILGVTTVCSSLHWIGTTISKSMRRVPIPPPVKGVGGSTIALAVILPNLIHRFFATEHGAQSMKCI
jgi:hypothetical protein